MWTREDNLFRAKRYQYEPTDVSFTSLEAFSVIRKVTVTISSGINIKLFISPFKWDEVCSLAKNYGKRISRLYFSEKEEIHIYLDKQDKEKILDLIDFFKAIKLKFHQPFESVISEFLKIMNLDISMLEKIGMSEEVSHTIKSHVNPNREGSLELFSLMRKYRKQTNFPISQFKKLLVNGENTNQQDADGWSPLCYALEEDRRNDLLELLLEYGANPFLRSYQAYTVFELAKLHSKQDKLAIISSLLSKPEKPLKVSNIRYDWGKEKVGVSFQFEEKHEFIVSYSPTSQFIETKDEKRNLFEIYKKTFFIEGEKEALIEEEFKKEYLSRSNKIISLIYYKDKRGGSAELAGSYLFDPMADQKEINIHGEYALFDPKFIGSGLNRFILLILAFSSQFIEENTHKIDQERLDFDTYYAADNWNSYRLIGSAKLGFMFTPKYLSDNSVYRTEKVILATGAKTIKFENMAWHIKEETQMQTRVNQADKQSYDISRTFYDKHVKEDVKCIYIPIRIPSNKSNFIAFSNSYKKMGVDVGDAIRNFAYLSIISGLFKKIVPHSNVALKDWKRNFSLSFSSSLVFWGKKKPKTNYSEKSKGFILAKL